MKLIFTICLLFLSCVASAQEDFNQIKHYFQNLATYNNRCTREQVYLHLDNNAYFEEETIWFSATVVFASNMQPTLMSHVLYVELLNSAGDIMQRKRLYIKNGSAAGEFKLDKTNHSGYYEIRAYTRAMLNWDASAVYSRVIPVFEHPKVAGDFSKLNCNDIYQRYGTRPKTTAFLLDNAKSKRGYNISFFPEGGNMVVGKKTTVTFKLTDNEGFAIKSKVNIVDEQNKVLCTTETEHQGMGSFVVTADSKKMYAEITNEEGKKYRFSLPTPINKGYQLNVAPKDTSANSPLELMVSSSSNLSRQLLGISIECRGRACYFDTISIDANQSCMKEIEHKVLGVGVNQITLFDASGNIIAERRVWGERKEPLNLSVKQNARLYKAFQPVVLNLQLLDKDDVPVQSHFSISVRDQGGDLVARTGGIREELLLSSDLKGYISNPSYYFRSNDAQHRRALDLLLQVQGWRRYDWKEMSNVTPFVLKQPIETGMVIDGKLVNTRKQGLSNYNVDITIVLPGTTPLVGKTTTDSVGNFAFTSPSFYGEGMGVFQATFKGKPKYSLTSLNRQFAPKPRGFSSQEIALRPPLFGESNFDVEPPIFLWNDTIKSDIVLGEVQIKEHGLDDYFGGKYSWGGGEEKGKQFSNIFYNTREELEAYMDAGNDVPGIWDWLAEKNKMFENIDGLRYKGHPVKVIYDNSASNIAPPVFLDEIKSLMIAENSKFIIDNNFMGLANLVDSINGTIETRDPVFIFVYSDPTYGYNMTRKGQRVTFLHGYTAAADFYAPDYRKSAMPDNSDFRRTLYWNPNVTTDQQGRANLTFYSNARQSQRICVSAQGITAKGDFIDFQR